MKTQLINWLRLSLICLGSVLCLRLAFGTVTAQGVVATYAGDLDAPVQQKPVTVRTEIDRGLSAVHALPVTTDPSRYQELLKALENANKQKNADTDGFLVGFYYAAWRRDWLLASIAPHTAYEQLAGIHGELKNMQFKGKCKKLELTTEQLTELFSDYKPEVHDAAWDSAVKAKKFRGTYPKS
jgi:hypothetical protein